MEEGSGAAEQEEQQEVQEVQEEVQQEQLGRQQLYELYVHWYRQTSPEVRPCREALLLNKVDQYLRRDPDPTRTFTLFPFYQAVQPGSRTDPLCRKHLCAFIKATEVLETLCVSLFLQPWRKEIRTLKTFTGPFVYRLLPVLSSDTIQSVLACIGYQPHTDTAPSEYRLGEDADPDRAMLLGFELLLARAECYHLLELLDKDQLGPQEWLQLLQRRAGPTKVEDATEKTTAVGQKEGEEKKKKKKKQEPDRKEEPLCLHTKLAVKPQPKPRRCHVSGDQSIVEMQMTYPDLAFRGRPLLPDKPQQTNSSKSKDNDFSEDSQSAELPKRDCVKGSRAAAAAATIHSHSAEVCGDDGRRSADHDEGSDGGRVDDELSGPQAVSLHITLRAGSTALQQTVAEMHNPRAAKPKLPSLSSMDEEQELRQLAERMGQLQDSTEENTRKDRRKTARKASTEEQNLRKPVMETGPALSHAGSRCSGSSEDDPTVMEGQKSVRAAESHQKGQDPERAETELLAQSFVIVQHHKK